MRAGTNHCAISDKRQKDLLEQKSDILENAGDFL